MSYRSVVSLVPDVPMVDKEQAKILAEVSQFTNQRMETMAYSIDDAFSLVAGPSANEASTIRVWNLNMRPPAGRNVILRLKTNLEFWNVPGIRPYMDYIVDKLPIHSENTYNGREFREILFLAVHHTVSWNHNVSDLRNVEAFARYHVSKGWPGIGYHFVVAPSGFIFQTNDLDTVSYHIGSATGNRQSIGVALGGDFRYGPPNEPQVISAAALVQWLQTYMPKQISVTTHGRFPGGSDTVCPGYNYDDWMKVITGVTPWLSY
jgi:hypothetical protein